MAEEDVERARALSREMLRDPALRREWLRQNNLTYVALIGIGAIMVQPFLSDRPTSTAGKVCLVAFAIAIPLLAALVTVNWQETFRGRLTNSKLVGIFRAVAQGVAFVGVVAGFWYIWWIAGVVFLATGVVALGVHSAGYYRVEYPEGDGSDNSESNPAHVDLEKPS